MHQYKKPKILKEIYRQHESNWAIKMTREWNTFSNARISLETAQMLQSNVIIYIDRTNDFCNLLEFFETN